MNQILDAATSLPTLIFTLLFIPVGLFWALKIFGVFGEHADGGGGDLHAGDVHVDGHGGDAHGGDAHGGDGHGGDGHGGDGHDGHHHGGFFGALGFGELPLTITGTAVVSFGWIISFLSVLIYPPIEELAGKALWLGAAFGLVAFAAAVGLTAMLIRPIRSLTSGGTGARRDSLVGHVAIVKTARVDANFGQAEIDGSLVQVRDPEAADGQPGVGLKLGQQALIFDYDSDREIFLVTTIDRALRRTS
jgi:membrane protein implicated in regulation of membrane protease activity